ncbi:hypothetical protein [Amycolatopsis sp. NPDC054798]
MLHPVADVAAGPEEDVTGGVPDVTAALAALVAGGGTVVRPPEQGPHEVRAVARDPRGQHSCRLRNPSKTDEVEPQRNKPAARFTFPFAVRSPREISHGRGSTWKSFNRSARAKSAFTRSSSARSRPASIPATSRRPGAFPAIFAALASSVSVAQGFPADSRSCDSGAQILEHLVARRVRMITNNPEKYRGLGEYGLHVAERAALRPIETPLSPDETRPDGAPLRNLGRSRAGAENFLTAVRARRRRPAPVQLQPTALPPTSHSGLLLWSAVTTSRFQEESPRWHRKSSSR